MSPADSRWSKMIPDDSRLDDLRWSQTQMIPVDPYPPYLGSFAWVIKIIMWWENNSRKNWLTVFCCGFYVGSLSCCRDYFCGSFSWCKPVRGNIKFPATKKQVFMKIIMCLENNSRENWLSVFFLWFVCRLFVMLPWLLLRLLKLMQTCSLQHQVSW